MLGNIILHAVPDVEDATTPRNLRRWGGLAGFLLAVAFIVAPFIYLVGNLRDALGVYAYTLADFLYGPVWAASLVTMIFALREQLGSTRHAVCQWHCCTIATFINNSPLPIR